jgi:lysophospholipase L1-like esterase
MLSIPLPMARAVLGTPWYPTPLALNTFAPIGDSRTAIITYDTNRIQAAQQQHLNQANMRHKFAFPITGVFATSGFTTQQIRDTWLKPALASRPAFLLVFGGVNDWTVTQDTNITFENLTYMCEQARLRGVKPVLFTDPGNTGMTSDQCTAYHGSGGLNDRLRAYATAKSIILIDSVPTLLATTNPVAWKNDPVSGNSYSYDGTHLGVAGAIALGELFATTMLPYVAAPADPIMTGNLITNADFATGTGGSVGTGNSGTLPSGFTGSRDSATTATAYSLNTRGDGAKEIVAAMTTTTATGTISGNKVTTTVTGSITPGNKYIFGCLVDIDAGFVGLGDVSGEVSLNYTDTTFDLGYFARTSSGKDVIPASGALTLMLQTFPMQIQAGKTLSTATARMDVRCWGTGSVTARYRKPYLLRVG